MELTTSSISNILKQSIGKLHFSDIDIEKVERNCFSIRYNSGGIMSAWYGSKLYVKVEQPSNDNLKTIITTTIKTSWLLYLKFYTTLLLGLIGFIFFLISHNPVALFFALLAGIIIPLFYIWIAEINNHSIKDRYIVLIHKELKKIEENKITKHN